MTQQAQIHEKSIKYFRKKGSEYISEGKKVNNTAKNTTISPNLLVWKFCGKTQFPHSFGRIARNSTETVPFYKISKPRN